MNGEKETLFYRFQSFNVYYLLKHIVITILSTGYILVKHFYEVILVENTYFRCGTRFGNIV